LNRGVRLETISRALGHADTRVTQAYYAELLDETAREEILRAMASARPRGAGTLAERDRLIDKPLEAQPVDQRARQHHSSVGDEALVVELNRHRVGPHGRPRILHHTSDLLTQATAALYSRFLPAQEVIFVNTSDGSDPATRWIEA
jgi:hypothetical protein